MPRQLGEASEVGASPSSGQRRDLRALPAEVRALGQLARARVALGARVGDRRRAVGAVAVAHDHLLVHRDRVQVAEELVVARLEEAA